MFSLVDLPGDPTLQCTKGSTKNKQSVNGPKHKVRDFLRSGEDDTKNISTSSTVDSLIYQRKGPLINSRYVRRLVSILHCLRSV